MINGLIYLLAAMILLAVLLYWNTQQRPYEADHHSEASDLQAHETPFTAPPAEDLGDRSFSEASADVPSPISDEAGTGSAVQAADDLTKIEGIGPKIAGLLTDAGFSSYATLAAAEVNQLEAILEAAGSRYRLADPSSWPAQARLAADGNWDKLAELQDELSGGRAATD